MLNRDSRTGKELASLLGVAAGFLSDIKAGKKTPSTAYRGKFQEHLGIPPNAWDLPLEASPALKPATLLRTPAPVPAPSVDPSALISDVEESLVQGTTSDHLDVLLSKVRRLQADESDKKLLKDWFAIEDRLLGHKAKYEEMVLKTAEGFAASPYFQSLVKDLLAALAPWPEARDAVREVLP